MRRPPASHQGPVSPTHGAAAAPKPGCRSVRCSSLEVFRLITGRAQDALELLQAHADASLDCADWRGGVFGDLALAHSLEVGQLQTQALIRRQTNERLTHVLSLPGVL